MLQGHVFVHSVWLTQGERPRAKSQKVAASAEYINESLSFYSSKHGQVFSKVRILKVQQREKKGGDAEAAPHFSPLQKILGALIFWEGDK